MTCGAFKQFREAVFEMTHTLKNAGLKILSGALIILATLIFVPAGNMKTVEAAGTYEIKINIACNTVTIYKDGAAVYAMPCSTGTATPGAGYTCKLREKYRWKELDHKVYGQYCSRITDNTLFHSVPCASYGVPNSIFPNYYDKLGTRASAGCIRLMVRDAKYIYDNVPTGSKITFYSDSSNPGPLGKPQTYKISDVPSDFARWDPTDPDPSNPWNSTTKYFGPCFDVNYYKQMNPELLAFGLDDTALKMHWVKYGVNEGRRASDEFDINVYKENYPDLVAQFGNNNMAYVNHYISVGRKEGRIAAVPKALQDNLKLVFDSNYYASRYPDVFAAFGTNYFKLFSHFYNYGIREGRVGCADFDVNVYKNNYPDLQAAFGDNYMSYLLHYVQAGAMEQRTGAFDLSGMSSVLDVDYYITKYPDIYAVFGNNGYGYYTHFAKYGVNEGRQSAPWFSIEEYKANYPDLTAVFGNDNYKIMRHFIDYGIREGRSGILINAQSITKGTGIIVEVPEAPAPEEAEEEILPEAVIFDDELSEQED